MPLPLPVSAAELNALVETYGTPLQLYSADVILAQSACSQAHVANGQIKSTSCSARLRATRASLKSSMLSRCSLHAHA